MRHITILVLLVSFVVKFTTANVIPASILRCVNKFAKDCPRKHKDFYCLCGKRQTFLKCLADYSAYGNFLEARDHFLGTCIEHIPDLSKHPDFNLDLPDKVEYASFPFPSSTRLLDSITSIEATASFDTKSYFTTSTAANSTAYIYPGQFYLDSSTFYNYQNSTMSILPIEEPLRNEQPDPTSLPVLPPLGPLSPPFYDIGGDCEDECKCDESDLDCIENKDIEHCIYKCISKKYDDGYDGEGDGGDDIDGNDNDYDNDYDNYDNDYDNDYDKNYDNNYDYDYDDYDTDHKYKYDECKSDDQNNCLYYDENIVTEYFEYKQAFLNLPEIDQQNDNINEESAKFWNEERKARNDVAKEFLQNELPIQQTKPDLRNTNNQSKNATENKEENNFDENLKNPQNFLHNKIKEEIKEEIIETKKDSNQKKNVTVNAVEFKFAAPGLMSGNQNPAIRQKLLESEKPKGIKDFSLLQSYSKRKNGKAYNKKKYYRKANLNSKLSREGRKRFEPPHLDSSKIPKEQRIKINKIK